MSTILLVDDNEGNRVTLSALLEDDGFAVHTAGSCAEARRLLSDVATTDLVLLDQHLGDGLGSELLTVVRHRLPRARIVMMSGSMDPSLLPDAADASFEKGAAFQDLLGLIRALLVEAS